MVAEGSQNAKQTFIELAKADTSGDYDKAFKIANKILQKFPKETLAFKCKLVALIQLGKFEDALAFANRIPFHQMGDCTFEKAYIQYRLDCNEAALETLSHSDPNDHRCMELKAQLLYRTEQFSEAADILKKLLKDSSDDYDEERRTNLIAIIAHLEGSGKEQPVPKQLETYEQLYNGACYFIEAGNYKEALSALEKSEKLCSATLAEEGLTEEECEDELGAIRVQKGFVLQKLGRADLAAEAYIQVQKTNPTDKSMLSTINNNLISTRQGVNMMEAKRKLKAAMQTIASKLTLRQRRTLALNQGSNIFIYFIYTIYFFMLNISKALLLMLSNQKELCSKCLQEIRKNYGPIQEAVIIEAALYLRCKEPQKAIAVLESADPTIEIQLTKLQVSLNEGKGEAINALNELPPEIALRPAIVQLRVALLLCLNRKKEALDLLTSVISEDRTNTEALLEQAASLNMDCGNNRTAVDCLERLAALKPKDLKITCRLIRAYSAFDVEKAEKLSLQVFPKTDEENIDIDSLEKSDWILYRDKNRQKKELNPQEFDSEIITGKLRKRKRKRKPLLPKNFDPKIPPDPERWLPKQERTAYKKRINKKHKDRDIGKGTQGAMSSPVQLESVRSKPENSPKPTPVMGEGPRQQRPAGQQPKKKKKSSKRR